MDIKQLIKEVQKRPSLYNTRISSTFSERKKLWRDITKVLYSDGWEDTNAVKNERLIKETQLKWKSTRDLFTRALRKAAEDEQLGIKRKRHLYFDEMQFLLPFCNKRSSQQTAAYVEDIKESFDSDDPPPIEYVQVGDQEMSEEESRSPKEENQSFIQQTSIASDMFTIPKTDDGDDAMENKKFLLSLVPFMKKLPDDVNLEVRLQIMSVIQNYSKARTSLL